MWHTNCGKRALWFTRRGIRRQEEPLRAFVNLARFEAGSKLAFSVSYTSLMVRLWSIALFLLAVPVLAKGQVRVTVPSAHFKVHERIVARIENTGKQPVSYCVEFGQSSVKPGSNAGETQTESTPTPFYVERRTHRGWSVLLIGPDIGSAPSPVVLDPGQSREFPFRLSGTGQVRLVLDYWTGESTETCQNPKKGKKTVTSSVFVIE